MDRRHFLKILPAAGSSLVINQEPETVPTNPDQEALEAVRESVVNSYVYYIGLLTQYEQIEDSEAESRISEFQSEIEACDNFKVLRRAKLCYDKTCHHMQSLQYKIRAGIPPSASEGLPPPYHF